MLDEEEIKLEATYWREVIKIMMVLREHFTHANEKLPQCLDEPKVLLEIQMQHLLPMAREFESLADLVVGRAKYLTEKGVDLGL